MEDLFGSGKDLVIHQMCLRAIVVFLITFVLIRISGRRSFGLHAPLDNIIVILLGAILSRAVVGASPFIPVVAASVAIVLLHRALALMISSNSAFSKLTQGEKIILYENGTFIQANIKKSLTCREEIMQSVRARCFSEELTQIDKIFMERNGEITIVKKEQI